MEYAATFPYSDEIKQYAQVKFLGYDHNIGAGDGTFWDMGNMCSDYYPVLSTRQSRKILATLRKPNGLYAGDGLYTVDGTNFQKWENGAWHVLGQVTDEYQQIVPFGVEKQGQYLLLFPAKKYYRMDTGVFGNMEESFTRTCSIPEKGTYNGKEANANTLFLNSAFPSEYERFDALTIKIGSYEICPCIEEIEGNRMTLHFLENVFAECPKLGWSNVTVTFQRKVPDLDFVFENENRLWGAKNDEIVASALGRPFFFYNFSGNSTDSYDVMVASSGDFTAACSFLGYPVFFKEDKVYKVYGSKPSNFQVVGSSTLGVEKGSSRSLAVAGERLFYQSRVGITTYAGGTGDSISHPLGLKRYKNVVGGSDGRKYYASMEKEDGSFELFVYDTTKGMWHKEDDTEAVTFSFGGAEQDESELYCLSDDGKLLIMGNIRQAPETAIDEGDFGCFVETNDFIENTPNREGLSKVQLRLSMAPGVTVKVYVKLDSEDEWRLIDTIQHEKKASRSIPIIPERCDHWRLKIAADGEFKLYSLARELYIGTDLHDDIDNEF